MVHLVPIDPKKEKESEIVCECDGLIILPKHHNFKQFIALHNIN